MPTGPGVPLRHCAIAFGASAALAVLVGVVAVVAGLDATGPGVVVVVLAAQWLPLVAWPVLVARRRPGGARAALALAGRPLDVPLGVGAAVAAVLLSGLLVALTPWRIDVPPAAEGLLGATGPATWALAAAVVVGAPVVEELFFRGALFGSLRRLGVATPVVVLLTAAAFALVHLEPQRLHVILVIGVVLGVLRASTGRLLPGVVAHMTVNATAAAAALLA